MTATKTTAPHKASRPPSQDAIALLKADHEAVRVVRGAHQAVDRFADSAAAKAQQLDDSMTAGRRPAQS